MALDSNTIVNTAAQLRQLNPQWSSLADNDVLYSAAAHARDTGVIDQYPELNEYLKDATKESRGIFGELVGGFGSGVDQFQAKLYDTAALAGDLIGNQDLLAWGEAGRDRNEAEAALHQPIIDSFEKINSASDFGYWLTNLVASQTPAIAGTVAAAVGAAAAAPEVAIGALGGLTASTIAGALGGGAVAFTQSQNYGDLKRSGGKDAELYAIGNGLIGGALNTIVPARLAGAVVGRAESALAETTLKKISTSLLDRVPAPIMKAAVGAAREGSIEMLAGIAQEAVTIGSEIASNAENPNFQITDNEIISRFVNNGVAGFILGGGLGAAGESFTANRRAATPEGNRTGNLEAAPSTAISSLEVPTAGLPPVSSLDVNPLTVAPTSIRESIDPVEAAPSVNQLVGAAPTMAAPVTAPAPAPVVAAIDPTEAAAAQYRAQQAELQASVTAARARQIEQARQRAAQQRAVEQIDADAASLEQRMSDAADAQAAAAQRARIVPFPIAAQPGETPVTPTLDPTAIRRNAQRNARNPQPLTAINPDGSAAGQFNPTSGEPLADIPAARPAPGVTETAPVVPFTPEAAPVADTPAPIVAAPTADVAPTPIEPAVAVAPASTFTRVEGNIPFVDNMLIGQRIDTGITPDQVVVGARPDERGAGGKAWTERETRNAALIQTPSGETIFVPVYRDRASGTNQALLADKAASIEGRYAELTEAVNERMGSGLSRSAVRKIIRGESPEGRPATAQRNAEVRAIAQELGIEYTPSNRSGPTNQQLEAFIRDNNGTLIGYAQFQGKLPGGARVFAGDPATLANAFGEAVRRSQDAGVYREGLGLPRGQRGASLDAPLGETTQSAVVADPNALIPGVSRTNEVPMDIAPIEPARNKTIAETAFNPDFIERLSRTINEEVTTERVAALARMNDAELHRVGLPIFKELMVEAGGSRAGDAFNRMNAADQTQVMREVIADAVNAEDSTLYRQSATDYRADGIEVNHAVDNVIRTAAEMGIDVNIVGATEGAADAFFRTEGGAYEPTRRTITLVMNNTLKPSMTTLITSLHEVLHDVVRNQPEYIQRAMHAMIDKIAARDAEFFSNPAADPRVRGGQNPSNLSPARLSEERLVEHLALRAVKTDVASGLVQSFWRAVVDTYYRSALWLQEKFLGTGNASGDLAQRWADNFSSRILAGDFLQPKFLDIFGTKPTMGRMTRMVFDDTVQHARYVDGTANYDRAGGGSPADVVYNVTAPLAALRESLNITGNLEVLSTETSLAELLGPESDPLFRATESDTQVRIRDAAMKIVSASRMDVAKSNQLARVLRNVFEPVRERYYEGTRAQSEAARQAGATDTREVSWENFLREHGLTDPEATAKLSIDSLQAQMEMEFGQPLDELPFDPNILIDQLPANERGLAELEFDVQVSKALDRIEAKIVDNQTTIANLELIHDKTNETIKTIDKNLGDIRETRKYAVNHLLESITELKRDLKNTYLEGQSMGRVENILTQLEGGDRADVTFRFTDKVLESLGVDELPLPSMLKALFALESDGGFDLAAARPADIKTRVIDEVVANSDSPLAPLVSLGEGPNARVKASALLAGLIDFAKNEAHVADVMRLQLSTAADAKANLLRIREVLNESNNAKLEALRATVVRDLRNPGNRVIQSMLNRRDRAIELNSQLSRAKQKQEYMPATARTLRTLRDRLDSRRGVGEDTDIVPGAKIYVPDSPEATSDTAVLRTETLTTGRDNFLKGDKVRSMLRKQAQWLDYRADKPDLQDKVYHMIKRQHERFKIAEGSDQLNATLTGLSGGRMDSLTEQLKRLGTPAHAQAARRWYKFSQLKKVHEAEMHSLGKKSEAAAEIFAKSVGVSLGKAEDIYYQPAMKFMGKASSLVEEQAFARVREIMQSNEVTREMALDDTKWKQFTNWLQSSKAVNERLVSLTREQGLGVRDERLVRRDVSGNEAAAVREAVERGVTGYTVPQRFDPTVAAVVSTIADRYKMLGDGPANPLGGKDTLLKVQTMSADLTEALAALNTPEFRQYISEPILTETSQTHVPAPARADGLEIFVPESIARTAWDASNGDIMEYARQVYLRMGEQGSTEALQAYQAQVLNFVGGMFRAMNREVNGELSQLTRLGAHGVAHYAMDARVADNFPASWTRVLRFTPETTLDGLHSVALNSAFGRNMEELFTLHREGEAELGKLAKEIRKPQEERERLRKEKGKEWFSKREDAEKALNSALEMDNTTMKVLNPEAGVASELGALGELYSGVMTGLLFGPKTALKIGYSVTDLMGLDNSFGVESLKMVGDAAVNVGRSMLGGIANIFGADAFAGNRFYRMIDDAGGLDRAAHISNADLLRGGRGRNNSLDNKGITGNVTRFARVMREFVNHAKLVPEGRTGPAPRAFNLFQWMQVGTNYSITAALMKRYENFAIRGAEFYANNPSKIGQELSASDLGYRDARGFENLKNEALLHGFSIEGISETALKRRGTNLDVFDKHTVQSLMFMATTRVAGDSSFTNRPAAFLGSKFAKMNSALIGWGFFKSAMVFRMMRDPQGRRTLDSVLKGATTIALGMVPAAVLFSYLLDQYDEELTGKKSSLMEITPDNWGRALLERSVAMGAFGVLGNVPDTVFNLKDGTARFGLSVDQSLVWLNSVTTLAKTIGAGYQMGIDNLNYSNFYRPIATSLGVGGLLQYAQIANKLAPDNTIQQLPGLKQEMGMTARTNAGNLLRAAGRSAGLELRAMSGATGVPNSVTPWLTNMALAAYSDDRAWFQESYRGAINAAREKGELDPEKYVRQSFATRHPLRSIFRATPSMTEYAELIRALPEQGRDDVLEAIRLMNNYGSALGIPPFVGSPGRPSRELTELIREGSSRGPRVSAPRIARPSISAEALRQQLAARRAETGGDY